MIRCRPKSEQLNFKEYHSGPLAMTMNYAAPDPIVFRLCSGSHNFIDNARGIIPNWDLKSVLFNISIWRARVRLLLILNRRGFVSDWYLTPDFLRVRSMIRPDGLRRQILYSVGYTMRAICSRMILPRDLYHSIIREWCGLISSSLALLVCSMLRLSDTGSFSWISWRLRLTGVGAFGRAAASGWSNRVLSRHFACG